MHCVSADYSILLNQSQPSTDAAKFHNWLIVMRLLHPRALNGREED